MLCVYPCFYSIRNTEMATYADYFPQKISTYSDLVFLYTLQQNWDKVFWIGWNGEMKVETFFCLPFFSLILL